MRLASSSRAVRCRRLPIAYRLLVARSDVVAARQARSQSPRGSPRRSRWAGPLGRKGRSSAFRYLLKQHFVGRKISFLGVGAGYWAGIAALPGKSIWAGLGPSGAARRLPAHRPPRPLGVGWPRAASGVRAKNQLFLAPTWTGEGGGKRLIRCRPTPPPRSLPAPPALPCQRPDRRLAAAPAGCQPLFSGPPEAHIRTVARCTFAFYRLNTAPQVHLAALLFENPRPQVHLRGQAHAVSGAPGGCIRCPWGALGWPVSSA